MRRALLVLMLLFVAVVIDGSSWVSSGVLLRESGGFGPKLETRTLAFDTRAVKEGPKIGVLVGGQTGAGKITVKATDKDGTTLFEEQVGSSSAAKILQPFTESQPLHVEVVAEDAVGPWSVRMVTMSGNTPKWFLHFGGPLQILVALGCVIWWRRRSGAAYRWFWTGAAIWTVGVGLKFVWAGAMNPPILNWIVAELVQYPKWTWIVAAGTYVGLLTGIFEEGATLVAGLLWKRLAADSTRAIAVGVGAGSFEALLIGVSGTIAIVRTLLGPDLSDASLIDMRYQETIVAPLFFAPLGRLLCTLCHTSTRVLVLFGIASKRWSFVLYGILLSTAVDMVVGCIYFANHIDTNSPWCASPFLWAFISVPVIYWCIRNWPREHAMLRQRQ